MGPKTFFNAAAVIFSVVGIVHLLRLIYGWRAVVAGWVVPTWVSWVAVVVAGFMAWHGWRFGKK